MDQIKKRLATIKWYYTDKDLRARQELADRMAQTARRQDLITYSDLIKGVTFKLPNVNGGQPFQIDPYEWTDLHRQIVGDFLGSISAESYRRDGIFVSAIVVSKADGTPGLGFVNFMRELGILTGPSEVAALEHWVEEVRKVHGRYKRNR